MAWFLYRTRIESETLVSRVRDTRIAPFRTSYRTLPTSYRTSGASAMWCRNARAIWCRKGAIRCTERCDMNVSDSIWVQYKNHAMISYKYMHLSLWYSISHMMYLSENQWEQLHRSRASQGKSAGDIRGRHNFL